MARAFYATYIRLMNSRPWTTTIVSTGCIVGIGDACAQQLVERRGLRNHDIKRTAKLAGMGFFAIGPGLRSWYIVLDKVVKGSAKTAALKKVLLDQTLWAPFFLGAFFTAVGVLDGKSYEEIEEKIRRDYLNALKVNYLIWPAVQLGNFYFVPVQHRVIIVNFVAFFWNTYLAWVSHKGEH